MKRATQGNFLSFEVDSSLLVQLGEQLVARRSIALAELIKNAYDADATRVRLVMQSVKTPNGSILVDDDGTGMTLDEVRNGWMRVATTAKSEKPISVRYGRSRAGSKGIGRFAARRLGNELLLSSTAEYPDGIKRCIEIAFDWRRDFAPGTDLGATRVPFALRDVAPDTPTGTALLIDELNSETWGSQDVEELQHDLLSLTPPFGIAEPLAPTSTGQSDPGFTVALEAPEFPDLEGEIKDQFLRAAWGVISGCVERDGKPHYDLVVNETGEHLCFSPADVTYASVGQVALKVHFMVYRADAFEGFAFGIRDGQRYGREYGGVRLYADGFRVFPYGDPGDDWLDLDRFRARRLTSMQSLLGNRVGDILQKTVAGAQSDRPLLLAPGNNQLFGAILVSRFDSPDIISNISREQVLGNAAFYELRQFAQLGISWMALQYARASSQRRKKQGANRDTARELIAQTSALIERTTLPSDDKAEALHLLRRTDAAVLGEREEHIGQVQLLRVLSATGAAVSLFDHQISAIGLSLSALRSRIENLRQFIRQGGDGEAPYEQVLEEAKATENLFQEQHSQLEALLGLRGRTRAVRVPLHNLADKVLGSFASYCTEQGIGVQNCIPSATMSPPMYQAELYAVFVHLLTNAIKAVEGVKDRRITVDAKTESDTLVVRMLDTGVGLDVEKREKVFEYFVSYSTPHGLLGTGTGLGLAVVHDTVHEYRGTVHFVDAAEPFKTCIEIRLPLRTGGKRE